MLFAVIVLQVQAQQKKEKIRFSAAINGSYLSGESQKKLGIETVVGLQYKKWFAGIGAAYDEYGYKSIPVFLELRRYFGKENNWQPFIYGDAGYNISMYSDNLPRKSNDVIITSFRPSFYGEAGIGVSKKIAKRIRLNLSAGYNEKQFSYTAHNNFWFMSYFAPQGNSMDYDFYYRRIVLRVGLQF